MSIKFSLNHHKVPHSKSPNALSSRNGFFLEGENGATVILIHGLTGTPNEMRYNADFLNQKGYSVLCPRLANHGEPISVLKRTTWKELYDSVRKAFLKAEETARGGPIFVGGLCMGALLGLLLAEEFGEAVSAVSCLAVTLFYDGWNMPWQRRLLPLAYWTPIKHFFYFKEDSPYGIKDETIRKRVHKYYANATLDDLEGVVESGYPYVPVTLLHQNHLLIQRVTKRLPSIKVPVQLIQAREDDTTSVKNSEFVYERIGSRIKEMLLLEDSYHLITIDRERDKVAAKMDEFFSRAGIQS